MDLNLLPVNIRLQKVYGGESETDVPRYVSVICAMRTQYLVIVTHACSYTVIVMHTHEFILLKACTSIRIWDVHMNCV